MSEQRDVKRVGGAITSNRGLCGAFNNIVKEATKVVRSPETGRAVECYMARRPDAANLEWSLAGATRTCPPRCSTTLFSERQRHRQQGDGSHVAGKHDEVVLVYNQLRAAVQITTREGFLPMTAESGDEGRILTEYIFETTRNCRANVARACACNSTRRSWTATADRCAHDSHTTRRPTTAVVTA